MFTAFWFRRDLRLSDNAGLHQALLSGKPVKPVFIFDEHILSKLRDRADLRVNFIHQVIAELKADLQKWGSDLWVYYGKPEVIWKQIIDEEHITSIYTNHDYEPYANQRDAQVKQLAAEKGATFFTFKDQVIFEKEEILSATRTSYTVYTPYSRAWLNTLKPEHLAPYEIEKYAHAFAKAQHQALISLADMQFSTKSFHFPSKQAREDFIQKYDQTRDFPFMDATTRLGLHLRFGTISIRALVNKARSLNETYLKELIWREFFMQILWKNPRVVSESFKKQYDAIPWRNNTSEFERWCEGKTGYPIVDAGMRELNETGFMHNRVRMITGSFLCKHLLIDWRWGEAYFAEKLLDYELSANNGNWQWVAGTGCDAAPYFRVFNPDSQAQKFDTKGQYIRKWVPELQSFAYPKPMVDHKMARERALATYKSALAQ